MTTIADATGPRLAELLGSLSLATDLAAGLPAQTAIRTSLVAVRLAAASDIQGFELADVYYTGLLRFLGCSAYSHEMAERFAAGDDLGMIRELTRVDAAKPVEALKGALRGISPRASLRDRGAALLRFATSPGAAKELPNSHCELAVVLARRLGMSEGVLRALGQLYERWDGRGVPLALRGDAIGKTSRVVHIAWRLAAHYALGGPVEAFDAIALRSGSELDPVVCEVAAREGGRLLADLDDSWSAFLAAEPRPALHTAPARLDDLARVFAHFSDVKSPWTVGHSLAVAERVTAAAGASATDVLRRAALLHDVGRVAVPNGVWDKRTPLDAIDKELIRTHTFETDRILGRTTHFASVAAVASMAHERLDASGYHRTLGGAALAREARLLQAADVHAALLADRPHRAAYTAERAMDILAAEAKAGRLCRDAVDAVLAAAGHSRGRRAALPSALTEREVEIVRLLARGKQNKEVATALGISPSTVKRHLENVYGKVGLRTRAAISVWALENDLI